MALGGALLGALAGGGLRPGGAAARGLSAALAAAKAAAAVGLSATTPLTSGPLMVAEVGRWNWVGFRLCSTARDTCALQLRGCHTASSIGT